MRRERAAASLRRPPRFQPDTHSALVAVILAVGVVATLRAPVFLSHDNLIEILRATSTYFIAACALAILIIAGGFDFSVGATFSVGAVVATGLMTHVLPWPEAVAVGLAAGAATGFLSGLIVVYLRVPPIIATLSVFFVASGLIHLFAKSLIAPLPDGFLQVAQAELIGVPLLVWYAVGVGGLAWMLLDKMRFGFELRAVGGNRDAAHASGIPVRRTDLTVYALCGGAAALAGILYASRTSAGQPDAGGYALTLQVLTMVLVGGVSLSGGVGSIGGVALGAVLVAEVQNALGVAEFDPLLSDVFIGTILALAVALDGLRRRKRFLEEPAERVDAPTSVSRLELERLVSGSGRVEAERIMAAVSTERRRIERDLHDGAQQHLVLLGLKLSMAERLTKKDPAAASVMHSELKADLHRALAELRDLAHGIYPVRLENEGLVGALSEAAQLAAIPTATHFDAVARYSREVELAAYFGCLEALQNAAKHAGDGATAQVALSERGRVLRFEVTDTGAGFDPGVTGRPGGIKNMTERVGDLGGSLSITSTLGGGTIVTGDIPLDQHRDGNSGGQLAEAADGSTR